MAWRGIRSLSTHAVGAFKGKNVLVTGGADGIGAGICVAFARAGATGGWRWVALGTCCLLKAASGLLWYLCVQGSASHAPQVEGALSYAEQYMEVGAGNASCCAPLWS